MSVVAVVVDGKWTPVLDPAHPANQRTDTQVIDGSMSDVDRIVSLLGQVVRLAQTLSPTDARRVRDFVHATESMLSATTYLPEQDQARFERALRERGEAG
ncbi:MAG: hypothetical protein ACXWNQ_03530 [Anaerolineales bacterium]